MSSPPFWLVNNVMSGDLLTTLPSIVLQRSKSWFHTWCASHQRHLAYTVKFKEINRQTLSSMNQPIWLEHSDFAFGNTAEDDELESESDFDDLDRPGPGIVEWSIDHYVITLPFVSLAYAHNPSQEKLDNLRNLLGHSPLDNTDVIMVCNPRTNVHDIITSIVADGLFARHQAQLTPVLTPSTAPSKSWRS